LAIDLITKRHECSYLFYLIDIAILFVGIPQTLTPLFLYETDITVEKRLGIGDKATTKTRKY